MTMNEDMQNRGEEGPSAQASTATEVVLDLNNSLFLDSMKNGKHCKA